MNKTFTSSTLEQKLGILAFIQEEGLAVSFYFKPEAHPYFKEKYPEVYGSQEKGSHMVNHGGELYLTAKLLAVSDKAPETVRAIMLQYWSGEGRDRSCYNIFRCPYWPKGIEMEIPISLLDGIGALNTPIG